MQPALFEKGVTVYKDDFPFGGETFDAKKDGPRLAGQLKRVYDVMRDGRWRTLQTLKHEAAPATEAAVSARLRDLRKKKFGGFTVETKRADRSGVWVYRLVI